MQILKYLIEMKNKRKIAIWLLLSMTIFMLAAGVWELIRSHTPLELIHDKAKNQPFAPTEIVAMKYDKSLNAYVCFYKTVNEGRAVAVFTERYHLLHLVRLSGICRSGSLDVKNYMASFIKELDSCIVWGCVSNEAGLGVEINGEPAASISDTQEVFWYIILPEMPDHTLPVRLLS